MFKRKSTGRDTTAAARDLAAKQAGLDLILAAGRARLTVARGPQPFTVRTPDFDTPLARLVAQAEASARGEESPAVTATMRMKRLRGPLSKRAQAAFDAGHAAEDVRADLSEQALIEPLTAGPIGSGTPDTDQPDTEELPARQGKPELRLHDPFDLPPEGNTRPDRLYRRRQRRGF